MLEFINPAKNGLSSSGVNYKEVSEGFSRKINEKYYKRGIAKN